MNTSNTLFENEYCIITNENGTWFRTDKISDHKMMVSSYFNEAGELVKNKKTQTMNHIMEILLDEEAPSADCYTADFVLTSFGEFINSPQLKDVYAGFQAWTSIKEDMFIAAYVIGTRVFVLYKADGITFLAEETIGSTLSNAGFHSVFTLSIGFYIDRDEIFRNCELSRKVFRKRNMKVTSVYTM